MAHLTKVKISNDNWDNSESELIVVGVYQDKTLSPMARSIDEKNGKLFFNAISIGDVKGKQGELHLFYIENKRVLLLGLGYEEKFDSNQARLIAGSASRFAIDKKIDNFSIECFPDKKEHCQAFGEGLVLGSYQFFEYQTKEENKKCMYFTQCFRHGMRE